MRIQTLVSQHLARFAVSESRKHVLALLKVFPEAGEIIKHRVQYYLNKEGDWKPGKPRSLRIHKKSGRLHDSIVTRLDYNAGTITISANSGRNIQLYHMFDLGVRKKWWIYPRRKPYLRVPEEHMAYQLQDGPEPSDGAFWLKKVHHPGIQARNITRKVIDQTRDKIQRKFRAALKQV